MREDVFSVMWELRPEETVDDKKMTVEKARWNIFPFTLSPLYRAISYEVP